ncbi:11971_t:CDS:1, partial [Acaulospora morrowiae]
MDLVKIDNVPGIIAKEFKRIIKTLHVSLDINVDNRHSTLKLCKLEFFTASKVEDQICDNIDPFSDDNA